MPPAGSFTPSNAPSNNSAGNPLVGQDLKDQNPTPQFQVMLETTQGDFVIAASDTVNGLYDQAKNFLNISDQGAQINDGQVDKVTLQEVDPNTGDYVDGQSYPVTDKKDVLAKVHLMGAR